jgi:hypothetical protein
MTRFTPLWEQAGDYAASVDRRLLGALWATPASSGAAVTPGTGMTVNIAPGSVAVHTLNNTGSVLCVSDAVETVTLDPAPPTGNSRYDLIICHPRAADIDGGSDNDFIFDNVSGVAGTSPAIPATPAGTVALARILVAGGSASIPSANITDIRPGGLGGRPRGKLAEQKQTANSPGTTTNVDWFTAPAFVTDGTRRVKVTFCAILVGSTTSDVGVLRLMEGGSILQQHYCAFIRAGRNGQHSVTGLWEGVPAAGPHTYKLNVYVLAGAGPISGGAQAIEPAFLVVEDIGT